MDPVDRVERRVNLAPKDPADPLDLEECLEREGIPVQLELLASLEYLVLMVSQESRASLESRVRRAMPGLQVLRDWPDLTDLLALLVWLV